MPVVPSSESHALIDAIFHPQSIAVVGASANPDTPGFDYLNSLQQFGFRGKVYPIKPKGGTILGLPVYASLRDVPGQVDYVISCIPNTTVLDLVAACGERGACGVCDIAVMDLLNTVRRS